MGVAGDRAVPNDFSPDLQKIGVAETPCMVGVVHDLAVHGPSVVVPQGEDCLKRLADNLDAQRFDQVRSPSVIVAV